MKMSLPVIQKSGENVVRTGVLTNPLTAVICLITTTCLTGLCAVNHNRLHPSRVLLLSLQHRQESLSDIPFRTGIQSARPGVLPGFQMNRQQAALPSDQRHQDRTGVEGHAADPMYRCESLQYNNPRKSVLTPGILSLE